MQCNCRDRERACSVCERSLPPGKYHNKEYNHAPKSKVTCTDCKKKAIQNERYLQERKEFDAMVHRREEALCEVLDSKDSKNLLLYLERELSYVPDSAGLGRVNTELVYMRLAFNKICRRYDDHVPSDLSLTMRWLELDRGYCFDSYQCDNVCPGAKQVPSLREYLDNN